jgi:hypothetical protein
MKSKSSKVVHPHFTGRINKSSRSKTYCPKLTVLAVIQVLLQEISGQELIDEKFYDDLAECTCCLTGLNFSIFI